MIEIQLFRSSLESSLDPKNKRLKRVLKALEYLRYYESNTTMKHWKEFLRLYNKATVL